MQKTVCLFRDSDDNDDVLHALCDAVLESESIECYVLYVGASFEAARDFGDLFSLKLCWAEYIELEIFRQVTMFSYQALLRIPKEVLRNQIVEITQHLLSSPMFFLSDDPEFPDLVIEALKHKKSLYLSHLPEEVAWEDATFTAGALLIFQIVFGDDSEGMPHLLHINPHVAQDAFGERFEKLVRLDTDDAIHYSPQPERELSREELRAIVQVKAEKYEENTKTTTITIKRDGDDLHDIFSAITTAVIKFNTIDCYFLYEGSSFAEIEKFGRQFELELCWKRYIGLEQNKQFATREYKGYFRIPKQVLQSDLNKLYHHIPPHSLAFLCLSDKPDFAEKMIEPIEIINSIKFIFSFNGIPWDTEATKAGAVLACMILHDDNPDRAHNPSQIFLAFPNTISKQIYSHFKQLIRPNTSDTTIL